MVVRRAENKDAFNPGKACAAFMVRLRRCPQRSLPAGSERCGRCVTLRAAWAGVHRIPAGVDVTVRVGGSRALSTGGLLAREQATLSQRARVQRAGW